MQVPMEDHEEQPPGAQMKEEPAQEEDQKIDVDQEAGGQSEEEHVQINTVPPQPGELPVKEMLDYQEKQPS